MKSRSIAELARVIHPSTSRHRGMALLSAYFDESGTHGNSDIIMIAGLLGSADQWAAFETAWSERLANVEILSFHASACDAADAEFANLAEPFRSALFNGLSQVICDSKLVGVNGTVWRAAWEAYKKRDPVHYPEPYYFCFDFCLGQIASWSKANAGGEPVALIFADQDEYESRALESYRAFKRLSPLKDDIASLTFADPCKFRPLQGADLFAYELYRYALDRRKNPSVIEPARRAAQNFEKAKLQIIGGFPPIDLMYHGMRMKIPLMPRIRIVP
jgi:hypothetical protein